MPIPALAQRIAERTKGITTTTDTINRRVETVEKTLGDTRVELAHVSAQVINLDGKVDVLVEEARHTRREREEREKRAENRADEELKFRRDRAFKVIGIVVPTLTALGALIAGIIAATREPEVKYIPRETPAAIEGRP